MSKNLSNAAGVFLVLGLIAAVVVGLIYGFVGLLKLGKLLGLGGVGAGFFAVVFFPIGICLILLVVGLLAGDD